MKLLYRVESFLAGFFLLAGTTISLYGVFMRYVLGNPTSWATEVYTLFFLWSIVLGLGIALRNNEHIAIELVYDRLPVKWKKVSDVLSHLVGLGFGLFLFIYGIQMVLESFSQGLISVSTGIPIWLTYLVIPINGIMFVLHFIGKLHYQVINRSVKEST